MERKDYIKRQFGHHLRKLRTEQKISIRNLAARAGLEYTQVQRIEKGQVNAALTTIYCLADGLGVSVSELMIDLSGHPDSTF